MQMSRASGNVVPPIATPTPEAAVVDAPPGQGIVGTFRGLVEVRMGSVE